MEDDDSSHDRDPAQTQAGSSTTSTITSSTVTSSSSGGSSIFTATTTSTTGGPEGLMEVTEVVEVVRETVSKEKGEVAIDEDKFYEREDVQKKTFAKWINSQLAKGSHPLVTDLFYDLRDGTRLLALLEVLTGSTYKREKGKMRVHHLNNVSRGLSILEQHNVKLVNISNDDIVDGSAKLTLGLVWSIILHWQVQGVLKDVMADLQQTNLEKTLLAWCRQTTKGYHGVDVRNFTTSWTDGLAFNALIHRHRPDLFDWPTVAKKLPFARLEQAFRLANKEFGIERLLDPEDVNTQVPDKKSMMMYIMCLFQALPKASFTMESLDVSIQSDSSFTMEASGGDEKGRPLSTVSIGLGGYQRTLEEVLTWLLGAEDRLAAMPPIAEEPEEVKQQFHQLEDLMLELTAKQGGIGDVLGEGTRLLKEGVMGEEEEEEIRVQMKLLNTRWEDLRVKAMDRQTQLHDCLMQLQQSQLENLKSWLTATEDRISNMSEVGPTTEDLRAQVVAHHKLQQDLEGEQANINSLSNMVVVVDEGNSDAAYSNLEDELNALGERWAHICRWAEQRWTTLQVLTVHWEQLEREMEKLGKWLDENEAQLKQMESNPSTDQEHLLRQAGTLQVLQSEMDIQQRRFALLQEESSKVLSNLPKDSPAHTRIPETLENLQDRWDCLVAIIEAQNQRLAASGIDIKRTVVPSDTDGGVVSSSTSTITHEGATMITKVITTKTTTTKTVEEGSFKRQKLEGESCEEFNVALNQLGGWMDTVQDRLEPKQMDDLSYEQLVQLCQHLQDEVRTQQEEYNKVMSLGQSAISETATIGESSSDSESKVTDFAARWQALSEMMANLQSKIEFMTERKKLTAELSAMEIQYQGFQRWFDTVRTVSENEPNAITSQVEQCKAKISGMKNHEQRLKEISETVNTLSSKWPTDAAAIVQMGRDFVDKWEALLLKLVDWGNALSSELEKQPPQSYLEALTALKRWLTNVEAAVTTEPLVISKLSILSDQLHNYKELLKTVEVEESSLSYINRTGNELISRSEVNTRLKGDLVELNKRWESAVAALKSRVENVEKAIEMLGQYRDEVSGLKSWLAEVDVFLHAEDAALGDIETLEAQLEQSNALQDDIATLETNVNSIKTTSGHIIQETNDEELRNEVSQQLKDLSDRWDVVLDLARRQNKSLKDALAKSQKVHEDISKLNMWLDKLELEFPAVKPIETSSELNNAIEAISKLREDIASHTDTFRSVNEIGNEMLQYENVASHDDMARQFTLLNGRWTDIISQIDKRHKTLTSAADQYAQFQVLCEEETSWLDQLEQKLEKSSKSAADAEEISEALDDLEIFLHGHHEERLQKVRELAEQLVQEGVMTFAVQNSTHDLTSRFNSLNAQANEQRTTLEGGVREAQAWEREYISVLEWLTHTDVVITQAVADPSTHLEGTDEVLKELSRQQEVLAKMEAQVQVYQSGGKPEAAQRLEDQVVHLRKKYEEVQGKLQQLNSAPNDFEARLKTMDAQLHDISQSVQLVSLTAGNPNAIQEQLNHCLQLYRTLSEVKGEVESVIATGRKIVKENQTSNPEGLTQQLDQLKALYNELGKAVTEQRGILEQSLRQSKKILKDGQHLEDWLSTTEHELDTREATVPLRSVQHELHFAQHALEDLGRKKPLLTGLQESYVTLTSLCGSEEQLLPLREHIDDIALTWERVYTRLCNRLQSMESEQDRKKDEMEKFIVGLGEIKGWLEVTENKLSNLTRYPAEERASIIKKVSQEVQDYKGQIESIRDTSVELISHGELFESRVQPELVTINQRWEHIFKTVTKQEAEAVVPDTKVETQKEVIQKVSSLPSTSKIVTHVMTKTTITSSSTSSSSVKEFQKEPSFASSQVSRPDEDQVDLYLREVSSMSDKITALKYKTKDIPHFNEAKEKVEGLEHEVALLEPDVATVISRGDTLTLTTHMVDVPRANSIRLAVNDLRQQWSTLKADTEHLKNETDLVNREIENYPEKVDALITWLNEVTKRLDLVNNDESQLEALEKEMASKKEQIDQMNETGERMKKYQYVQLQPILTLINTRWTELTMQFRQYRKVPHETKTIVPGSKEAAVLEPSKVPDYVASVNRLREAISAISRQLNAPLMNGKEFDNLNAQEEELKVIKQGLDTLKPRVDSTETEREGVMNSATQSEADQVRRVVDKLRQEWAQVNRGYTEHHARWLHASESLCSLHKMTEDFSVWLSSIEEKVQTTTNQPLPEAKTTQKDLEKQVTLKHRPSQNLQTKCKEITEEMNVEDGRRLQDRVDNLMKRWRSLLLDLAARRERIAAEETGKDTSTDYEDLVAWIDQAQGLMDAPVNVTDEASLSAHITMVQNHIIECGGKQVLLKRLKEGKPKGVTPSQIATLETNMTKIANLLPEYKNNLDTKQGVIKTLGDNVEDLYKWTEEMRVRVALHNLTQDEVKQMRATLREKTAWYESLDSTYWVLAQDAESRGLTVSVALKNRMNSIESRLKALQAQLAESSASSASPSTSFGVAAAVARESGGDEQENKKKVIVEAEVEAVKEDDMASSMSSSVTSSVTTVIHNIRMEESVLSTEGDIRPPSPLVCPPKHSPDSSPAVVLASLDKSILQIRDWLTLVEQMVKQQTAVVGDSDDIRTLIEKQKSVLRELESKKPQLDELVASADSLKDDASRTQLHQKVSKLREHWDETNSSVLQRKTQLDVMMADTHKFDVKRAEVETWLARLEARMERMAPVAHTADILDQQIREQKGIHAELHQYKHQMELFNQMTQRLITIYQHDDTRKIKKITETINMRYSNLSSSIIARGKVLHSAMNSLHNFDKALDKFRAWLSETESLADQLDMEVDKLGPGRREMQPRGPSIHLKDLQSEIESHKDVLASLNATGQKLLGTLDNQDEAVMLQRRLEEMNQRWNNLKHKSMAIRNRLEGNAENWNSLLLSLRELIEWVIRKDTELNALGPLVGDISALTKYEEDLTVFRRVLDEKQPVIESNLKSGRQLIASEPPLSDTSDSEAGRDLDGDNRYRGEETARDLTRSVRREVAKLSEKWAALRERAGATASQANLANKKLGVLQKTVEEVGGRLEEAEKTVAAWGTVPQDPNLADQHVHNVKKFREGLADLQRGVDDVNDQAARFSAHNVPLTPANSARLHDLNNRWKTLETTVNDRWRQLAGRSREVTPMTPAQLASSVAPPWERATASNKVPYYINHDRESTHWDHPDMMELLDSMAQYNHIKFSAYRTAMKLRTLQKKLALEYAKLQTATGIFDEHGLRGQNDRLIDVNDMVVVLSALYASIASDHPEVNTTLAMDLCLNWLLNVYDSQRTGQMRVLSFKVGLVCLCTGHLEEKYRYMFRLIADLNRLVDQRKLGLLLHDCVQVPRQLGEVAAFGGSNIEPSVRSCFTKAGKDRETIEAVHFLSWVQQEPQSLVWLAVLHRVAASENVHHQVKCNICKAYPVVGLRYRCLKCLSFDMCQQCFFGGRSNKSHKVTHPMHEYCTATTTGEDMKDFTKALKNKFKSKRSLQKHAKKGYLPVQTVLEGDALESPAPSPQHNVSSQDMHTRLEMYASRLAEVELRTNSNSTPDSEDEHGLIAQYCQSLSSSDAPLPVPRSPLQIMAAVDAEQKEELEAMIRDLEEENKVLQAEYDRLKAQKPVGSPPEDFGPQGRSETDMIAEAKLLREHKGRLEARMSILEEHNRQLEAQLHRLRQLLEEPSGASSPNKSGTLQTKSVTASQLAMDSPAKVNGHSTAQGGSGGPYEGLEQMSEYVRPPPPPLGSMSHVGNLFSRAGDLGKAVGTLVATMTDEGEKDSRSSHHSTEDSE